MYSQIQTVLIPFADSRLTPLHVVQRAPPFSVGENKGPMMHKSSAVPTAAGKRGSNTKLWVVNWLGGMRDAMTQDGQV